MKTLIVDPGHGGSDPGATGHGLKEKDLNLTVCLELVPLLKSRGVNAILTRGGDTGLSLKARTDLAAFHNGDAVLSVHHNAGGGRGTETYCSLFNVNSRKLVEKVHAELVEAFPELPNRGIKTRRHPSNLSWDYYHMIREPHRAAGIPSVITETGFVDNATDAAVMKKADFARRQAEALAKGVCSYFGVPWNLTLTPILGVARATVAQAQAWAKARGAHQRFIDIAPTYWQYDELTGIRPEVLYAQAAKETAFGKYSGAVVPDQNNWAGIKIKNPVADRTEDHETFATPADGVRAHFNHMSAYVGLSPIGVPHARYYVVKSISWAGTVTFIEELGGKWAPAAIYGQSIIKDYLNPLLSTPAPAAPIAPAPVPGEIATIRAENEALKTEIKNLQAKIAQAVDVLT